MVDGDIAYFSHFFTILPRTPGVRVALREFLETLIEKKLTKKRGKFHMEPACVYAGRSKREGTYSLHINEWDAFWYHMQQRGFKEAHFTFTRAEPKLGVPVALSMGEYLPWENQVPVIDFALAQGRQVCITTQPGGGKTLMFLFIAAALGRRFCVQTMGGWEGRWLEAFYQFLKLEVHEVRSCCGCSKLYALIREKKKTGIPDVKAIFISNGAIRTYIKNYELGLDVGTGAEGLPPHMIYDYLGIGLRGVDETHREFHANFMADLHCHVPKTVYLTGTLFPRDEFMKNRYETMLPHNIRKEAAELRIYTEVINVLYNLKDPHLFDQFLKTSVYSHNEFEKVIIKHKPMLDNYLLAIYNRLLDKWVLERVEGTRILVFTGLIEMGQIMLAYLRRRMPDLIINTFNAGDDYIILESSDIILSTVLKAGTAVDISELVQVHNLVASDSPNQNVQTLGRLRELKHRPDITPEYHSYTCLDIPKQVTYQERRDKLFKPRVVKIREERLGRLI